MTDGKEGYQPSEEEVSDAEDRMDNVDRIMSDMRENIGKGELGRELKQYVESGHRGGMVYNGESQEDRDREGVVVFTTKENVSVHLDKAYRNHSAFGPLGLGDWGLAGWYKFTLFRGERQIGGIKILDPFDKKSEYGQASCYIDILGRELKIDLGTPSRSLWVSPNDFRPDFKEKIGNAIDEMISKY